MQPSVKSICVPDQIHSINLNYQRSHNVTLEINNHQCMNIPERDRYFPQVNRPLPHVQIPLEEQYSPATKSYRFHHPLNGSSELNTSLSTNLQRTVQTMLPDQFKRVRMPQLQVDFQGSVISLVQRMPTTEQSLRDSAT